MEQKVFQWPYICWHWHDEVQITLILEGEFICQAGSERIYIGAGEIVFINSCVLHQIIPCKKSYGKLYSFIWNAELLAENKESDVYQHCIAPVLSEHQKLCKYEKINHRTDRIRNELLCIVSLISEKKDYYELRIHHILSGIWLDICDYSKENDAPVSFELARDDRRVKDAMQYMKAHYGENISLEDIARAIMISRSELCKCFRRTLDITPKDFLLQYRIRHSMILLQNHELRIADIAEMTGFSSPSHFGSCFQKRVGCTPSQYRKSM